METENRSLCKAMSNDNSISRHYQYGCDNIAFGGLLRCLFVAGLWPITLETPSSIQNILAAFRSMQNSTLYLDGRSAYYHTGCGPSQRMNSSAQVILAEIKSLQLKDVFHLDADCFTNDN